MRFLRDYLDRYRTRRHLRQWGMIGPILVLVLALPMLRPLRHPTQPEISQDEAARLATVQALGDEHTLSVGDIASHAQTNRLIRGADGRIYADQPPVFAVLLAVPYTVMRWMGFTFSRAPILVPYLLTLIGVTLPVMVAAGLLYRMGRLFELPRPLRALLACSCVIGGGLISYATVLNAHAPAAALVLCAAGCLIHLAISERPSRGGGWLVLAGSFASLAAVIDSGAIVFLILLALVILAMRWRVPMRLGGVILYAIGCVPAILLHAVLVVPITGDWRIGAASHPELAYGALSAQAMPASALDGRVGESTPILRDDDVAEDDVIDDPLWISIGHGIGRLLAAIFGAHGLLSHFPIAIVGVVGIGFVMHRHWPATTKTLAAVTAIAALAIVVHLARMRTDPQEPMFASRRFIVFLPLLLFWSGAWLRREHHPAAWSFAGALLAFSIVVGLIGATFPFPRDGYSGYTVTAAARKLISPHKPTEPAREALAGRWTKSIPSDDLARHD